MSPVLLWINVQLYCLNIFTLNRTYAEDFSRIRKSYFVNHLIFLVHFVCSVTDHRCMRRIACWLITALRLIPKGYALCIYSIGKKSSLFLVLGCTILDPRIILFTKIKTHAPSLIIKFLFYTCLCTLVIYLYKKYSCLF